MIRKLSAGGDVRLDWRSINQVIDENTSIKTRLVRLENPSGRRQIYADGAAPTPFEIYQTDTWLKYKVKQGYVITTGEPIEPTNIETEITITAGVEFYWIYVSLTATTATVLSSATLPTWSISIVPIGWVDTLTGEADTIATINQFLHDNIFVPCTL